MAESIRPLTTDVLHAQAASAAEQGIPLCEANHYEQGSKLWHLFNNAYRAALHANECEVA
jgi:putative NIF3 family GTP cyclohydrolase 1 type 2